MKSAIDKLKSAIKNISLVILLLCFHNLAHAQDTCRVYRNKQLMLTKTNWDDNNTKLLKIKPAMTKKDNLVIHYNAVNPQKNWQRFIIITNDKDETLLSKVFDFSSGKYVLSGKDIATIAQKARKISVYTYSYPKDPALAATIRIRRLLVCQLEFN